MNSASQLARPICGEIDNDGRLLRADEALRKLNRRAGGEEGGIIAIPPLLALAQLTLKLRMRLSRAVRVADDSESLELWVEIEPEGDIAYLSIVSWRALPTPWTVPGRPIFDLAEANPDASYLRFDPSSRLIRATGIAVEGLVASDFGKPAADLLAKYFAQSESVAGLIDHIQTATTFPPMLLNRPFDDMSLLISGTPVFDAAAIMIAYDCHVESLPDFDAAGATGPNENSQGVLFGKHLAPVLHQPLGRIIANAETIGSELQGQIREYYALYARDIANAARHLSALVEDLGDLEAVERPGFTTAPDRIELGDVARRVAGLLALKAADHNIEILTPPSDQHVPAIAEFRRVLQIMLNLVSNAVRYSPDGTQVMVEIEKDGDNAIMAVSDQGAGIAPENREKIFRKFERLGRSGDGGSGLGLYISRKLARALGGELTVGDAESGGAKFTLRLPTDNQR